MEILRKLRNAERSSGIETDRERGIKDMKCTCCGHEFRFKDVNDRKIKWEYRCPHCNAVMKFRWQDYLLILILTTITVKVINHFTDTFLGTVIALAVLFVILYPFRNLIVELEDYLHLHKWVKDE